MVRKLADLPEQRGLSYPQNQQAIPPRRSATAEQIAARHRAQQSQPTPSIIRPGYDQRQRTARADFPPASKGKAGHHAGLHPEEEQGEYDVDGENGEPDEPAYPRSHTSALPYPTTGSPKLTKNMYPSQSKPTRRLERSRLPLVVVACLCAGMVVMLVGWVLFTLVGTWWQTQRDDWQYGRPRTYQVDAVVGHGDSPTHPSHFIALNLNRQVMVIEIPGGNPSKPLIYIGPTLVGDGQDLTPVTLSFEDRSGKGKLDMVIHIGDQEIVFQNNGQKFVSPQQH